MCFIKRKSPTVPLKTITNNKVAGKICMEAAKLYEIDRRYRERLESGEIAGEDFLSSRKAESIAVIGSIMDNIPAIIFPHPRWGLMCFIKRKSPCPFLRL